MLVRETNQTSSDAVYFERLEASFRGGLVLLAGALLCVGMLPKPHDLFLDLLVLWLPAAWIVFSIGACLGYFLPRLLNGRSLPETLVRIVIVGVSAAVVLAVSFWLIRNHRELLGLIINRHSRGYDSYLLSVRSLLGREAWKCVYGVVPVGAVWICGWAWFAGRKASADQQTSPEAPIRLAFDVRLVQVVAVLAVSLAFFATAILLFTAVFTKATVPLSSFLIVGPAAGGLVILGPFLGPMIRGSSLGPVMGYAALAFPVLIATASPFVLCRRAVRPGMAVAAWCAFVAGLLFWTGTGALCLAASLG